MKPVGTRFWYLYPVHLDELDEPNGLVVVVVEGLDTDGQRLEIFGRNRFRRKTVDCNWWPKSRFSAFIICISLNPNYCILSMQILSALQCIFKYLDRLTKSNGWDKSSTILEKGFKGCSQGFRLKRTHQTYINFNFWNKMHTFWKLGMYWSNDIFKSFPNNYD